MKQYLDFFYKYRNSIDSGCSPLVNACRNNAFENFLRYGFPRYKSENYQYLDVEELLKEDFGFYLNPADNGFNPRLVFHCDVPNLDSYKSFAVNGHFFETAATATDCITQSDTVGKTFFSGSLNEFADRFPDIFAAHYNSLAGKKGNGLTAFNTSFVQGGYVLYVPENVEIAKTVQLTNISGGNAVSLVNRRMLIILERGAKARLLVCDHSYDEKPLSAATQVTEIFVGEGARFDFCEMEESGRNTVRLAENFVTQAADSDLQISNITLSNGITRNNYIADLAGERSSLRLHGMAIADERQKIDNYTVVNHLTSNSKCEELFKYVLDDEATGVFGGRIIVAKEAQKTEAFQSNRNLLGSRECRMFSKPQLEIYADDVKCSHGMTTGQIDEQALFYMRQRGIPFDEAVLLLKFAFMSDVIQSIGIEGLRERLKMLVEKRFRGELATCRGCNCR